jgi:hypothetical protein
MNLIKKNPPATDRLLETTLKRLHAGDLMIINSRRKNGVILGKDFHAEFAGPGAAIGGTFDLDCQWIIPLGTLSLLEPSSYDDRRRAYGVRWQWMRRMQRFTDEPAPLQRAQNLLDQFEHYFDATTILQVPSQALALTVGVFPQTLELARLLPKL